MSTPPLAAAPEHGSLCLCTAPVPPKNRASRRPFRCLRCQRVLHLAAMMNGEDIVFLKGLYIAWFCPTAGAEERVS